MMDDTMNPDAEGDGQQPAAPMPDTSAPQGDDKDGDDTIESTGM